MAVLEGAVENGIARSVLEVCDDDGQRRARGVRRLRTAAQNKRRRDRERQHGSGDHDGGCDTLRP